jgi:predicted AAA+ superfamily ATPase
VSLKYVRRHIDERLDALVPHLPAILLDGPKGVGKTLTALQRAKSVLRLDTPQVQNLVAGNLESIHLGDKPILLDEWQRSPEVWTEVKRAVDSDNAGGQYILTGSFPSRPTHSGAGRIVDLRMRPMTLIERQVATSEISLMALSLETQVQIFGETKLVAQDYMSEVFSSGFPGMRSDVDEIVETQISAYVNRIVDVDVAIEGVGTRKPASLMAWLKSYAAATSTTSTMETIRDSSKIGFEAALSRPAVESILEALTRLRILDDVPAWIPLGSDFARLGSLPKRYLADPALAVNLLGYRKSDLLSGQEGEPNFDRYGPLIGRLFEALAVLCIRVYAETNSWKVSHFRDRNGRREVDLILEVGGSKVIAVEIKLAQTPRDSDFGNLLWLKEQLGDSVVDSVLITTGPYAYRHNNGVAVVPLGLLGP